MLYYNEEAYAEAHPMERISWCTEERKAFDGSHKIGKTSGETVESNHTENVGQCRWKPGRCLPRMWMSCLNHNVYKEFTALRPALLAAERGKQVSVISVTGTIPGRIKDIGAYLMVFHRDETHGLYMAVSRDSYTLRQ